MFLDVRRFSNKFRTFFFHLLGGIILQGFTSGARLPFTHQRAWFNGPGPQRSRQKILKLEK